MVVGGGQIYEQTLDMVDFLYLTIVHRDFEGDTFFPQLKWEDWSILNTTEHDADEENNRPAFTIMTLKRA